jgi:hypothetical protein
VARERDYAAEYAHRQELAQERGFSSYGEEREFRYETRFEREIAGESELWREFGPGGDYRSADPQQLAGFYEFVLEPTMHGGEPTGMEKHNAVSYFIDEFDMTEDEAVAAMKEAFGYE